MGLKDVLANLGLIDADASGTIDTTEVLSKPEESAALLNQLRDELTTADKKLEDATKEIAALNILKQDITTLAELDEAYTYRLTPTAKNKLVSIKTSDCARAFIFHEDGVYQVCDGVEHKVGCSLNEVVTKLNNAIKGEPNATDDSQAKKKVEYIFEDGTTIVQEA